MDTTREHAFLYLLLLLVILFCVIDTAQSVLSV